MTPPKKAERRDAGLPGTAHRASVMLIDDHPFMRAGMAQLIDRQPDFAVCCEASDTAEAMRELKRGRPDLVLTDISMPGRSGLDFIKDILSIHSGVPILVVSMHDEAIFAERALRAGARGYIMKEAGGESLLAAMRKVAAGEVYLSPKIAAQMLNALTGAGVRRSKSPIHQLTEREFEVFQQIGAGKNTREIARALALSPKTVDVHRGHIREKLGLRNSTELVRHAVRWLESRKPNA